MLYSFKTQMKMVVLIAGLVSLCFAGDPVVPGVSIFRDKPEYKFTQKDGETKMKLEVEINKKKGAEKVFVPRAGAGEIQYSAPDIGEQTKPALNILLPRGIIGYDPNGKFLYYGDKRRAWFPTKTFYWEWGQSWGVGLSKAGWQNWTAQAFGKPLPKIAFSPTFSETTLRALSAIPARPVPRPENYVIVAEKVGKERIYQDPWKVYVAGPTHGALAYKVDPSKVIFTTPEGTPIRPALPSDPVKEQMEGARMPRIGRDSAVVLPVSSVYRLTGRKLPGEETVRKERTYYGEKQAETAFEVVYPAVETGAFFGAAALGPGVFVPYVVARAGMRVREGEGMKAAAKELAFANPLTASFVLGYEAPENFRSVMKWLARKAPGPEAASAGLGLFLLAAPVVSLRRLPPAEQPQRLAVEAVRSRYVAVGRNREGTPTFYEVIERPGGRVEVRAQEVATRKPLSLTHSEERDVIPMAAAQQAAQRPGLTESQRRLLWEGSQPPEGLGTKSPVKGQPEIGRSLPSPEPPELPKPQNQRQGSGARPRRIEQAQQQHLTGPGPEPPAEPPKPLEQKPPEPMPIVRKSLDATPSQAVPPRTEFYFNKYGGKYSVSISRDGRIYVNEQTLNGWNRLTISKSPRDERLEKMLKEHYVIDRVREMPNPVSGDPFKKGTHFEIYFKPTNSPKEETYGGFVYNTLTGRFSKERLPAFGPRHYTSELAVKAVRDWNPKLSWDDLHSGAQKLFNRATEEALKTGRSREEIINELSGKLNEILPPEYHPVAKQTPVPEDEKTKLIQQLVNAMKAGAEKQTLREIANRANQQATKELHEKINDAGKVGTYIKKAPPDPLLGMPPEQRQAELIKMGAWTPKKNVPPEEVAWTGGESAGLPKKVRKQVKKITEEGRMAEGIGRKLEALEGRQLPLDATPKDRLKALRELLTPEEQGYLDELLRKNPPPTQEQIIAGEIEEIKGSLARRPPDFPEPPPSVSERWERRQAAWGRLEKMKGKQVPYPDRLRKDLKLAEKMGDEPTRQAIEEKLETIYELPTQKEEWAAQALKPKTYHLDVRVGEKNVVKEVPIQVLPDGTIIPPEGIALAPESRETLRWLYQQEAAGYRNLISKDFALRGWKDKVQHTYPGSQEVPIAQGPLGAPPKTETTIPPDVGKELKAPELTPAKERAPPAQQELPLETPEKSQVQTQPQPQAQTPEMLKPTEKQLGYVRFLLVKARKSGMNMPRVEPEKMSRKELSEFITNLEYSLGKTPNPLEAAARRAIPAAGGPKSVGAMQGETRPAANSPEEGRFGVGFQASGEPGYRAGPLLPPRQEQKPPADLKKDGDSVGAAKAGFTRQQEDDLRRRLKQELQNLKRSKAPKSALPANEQPLPSEVSRDVSQELARRQAEMAKAALEVQRRMLSQIEEARWRNPQTGLFNRNYITDNLNELLRKNKAVMYLDLNDLKWFNDTFGHEAGDVYIEEFAKLLNGRFAKSGVKWTRPYESGDEFVGFVGGDGKIDLNGLSRQIRDAMAELGPKLEKRLGTRIPKPLSVSVGWTRIRPSDIEGAGPPSEKYATILRRAERRMYEEKRLSKKKQALEAPPVRGPKKPQVARVEDQKKQDFDARWKRYMESPDVEKAGYAEYPPFVFSNNGKLTPDRKFATYRTKEGEVVVDAKTGEIVDERPFGRGGTPDFEHNRLRQEGPESPARAYEEGWAPWRAKGLPGENEQKRILWMLHEHEKLNVKNTKQLAPGSRAYQVEQEWREFLRKANVEDLRFALENSRQPYQRAEINEALNRLGLDKAKARRREEIAISQFSALAYAAAFGPLAGASVVGVGIQGIRALAGNEEAKKWFRRPQRVPIPPPSYYDWRNGTPRPPTESEIEAAKLLAPADMSPKEKEIFAEAYVSWRRSGLPPWSAREEAGDEVAWKKGKLGKPVLASYSAKEPPAGGWSDKGWRPPAYRVNLGPPSEGKVAIPTLSVFDRMTREDWDNLTAYFKEKGIPFEVGLEQFERSFEQ